MAPFTICTHRPLPYQCGLPQKALFLQSKMSPELLSGSPGVNEDLPLSHFCRTSIMKKIRVHLWHVIWRVVNFCTSVSELFSSKMFFFICVGQNMTMNMISALKKNSVEALEHPGLGCEIKDEDSEVIMELDDKESAADEQELFVIDWDEEEEDEARLSEWESGEETDEEEEEDEDEEDCQTKDEDSEWSDEDDDDEGDSEASAESLELWESFLNNSDPYNPLRFCSPVGSRTNTKKNQQTPCSQSKTQSEPAERLEECEPEPKPNSKEKGKKVCFSDKVAVHPLVAWSFASRAARDGSCWMQMARDRERFRRRVESIETVLKPCLTAEHRAGVWERLHSKTSS
ncbi:protein phosphatase 1 regulatory subunit 15A [Garra rufa]|uniref:protein phosphatase 1 regulatory subunit 15A n=1 Tax=Garra rufa TaxID=137080 RepID=UPI003CCED8F3